MNSVKGGVRGRICKLRDIDIPIIRKRLYKGDSPSQIARDYDVTPTTIRHIRDGLSWTHVPKVEGDKY